MKSPYKTLAMTLTINTIVMFFITYAMIASIEHFYPNINRFYMSLMMVAPMGVVMMIAMRKMFENKKLNIALMSGFVALFIISLSLARTQTPVGDDQFLRSMIPHHSSAILMCEQSQITDPELIELCEEIVQTQREEIAIMQRFLNER